MTSPAVPLASGKVCARRGGAPSAEVPSPTARASRVPLPSASPRPEQALARPILPATVPPAGPRPQGPRTSSVEPSRTEQYPPQSTRPSGDLVSPLHPCLAQAPPAQVFPTRRSHAQQGLGVGSGDHCGGGCRGCWGALSSRDITQTSYQGSETGPGLQRTPGLSPPLKGVLPVSVPRSPPFPSSGPGWGSQGREGRPGEGGLRTPVRYPPGRHWPASSRTWSSPEQRTREKEATTKCPSK